jgi:hypothetical protein
MTVNDPLSAKRYAPLTPAGRELHWRWIAMAMVFLVAWPVVSIGLTPSVLHVTELFAGVPWIGLAAGALVTSVEMAVEFFAIGLVLAALALMVARLTAWPSVQMDRGWQIAQGLLDSALVAASLFAGISLELPAVLYHPVFHALEPFPVVVVTMFAVAAAFSLPLAGAWMQHSRGAALKGVCVVAVLMALGWGMARFPPQGGEAGGAAARQRIVLGLDSLSFVDDLEPLRALAREHRGIFFEAAVTPGLLTNSVWPAILASQRASELGTYFIFQAPDWNSLPPTLVDRARAAGLETHSYFSDQFTLHVGSDLAFDHNHSGPRGWKQAVSAGVKDASVFLPVILPWFPELPGRGSPPNQAGTYAFSLRRELGEIFAGARRNGGSLVLGHIDYLHQARFPGLSELTDAQRAAVRSAPLSGLVDRSIDWQYPNAEGDPIGLYAWKVRRLQEMLAMVVRESGVLDPGRNNQLILFSDHGARTGVTEANFGDDKYRHVPLVSFGTATRDSHAIISLLDVSSLVGLPDEKRPAPHRPLVEYANVSNEEWASLVKKSRPRADGGVDLDREILKILGARLRVFDPTSTPPAYQPAPSTPVIEQPERPTALSRLLATIMGH